MTRMNRILILLIAVLAGLRPATAASWAEEREAVHTRQFAAEGRHELVVAQCRQFRERFPSSQAGDLILDLEGRAWLALQRPAEALGAFQSLVQRHSSSPLAPAAQLAAGECLARLGRAGEAVKQWRRLAQQHPGSPEAVQGLLKAEESTPRSELAAREELLRLAAELDSESDLGLEARRRWALLLVEQGHAAEARQLLDRVLRESAPGAGQLRALLELDRLLVENQQGEDALALLVQAEAQYEDDPLRGRLWLALATRRLELGRLLEAERGLRYELEQEDAAFDTPAVRDSLRLLLGDALVLQGAELEAEGAWAACARQTPAVLLRRGLALARAGAGAQAVERFTAALDSLSAAPSLTHDSARLLAVGLLDLAREQDQSGLPSVAWERVGELSRHVEPDHPEATELAEILLRQGLLPEAARLLEAQRGDPLQADRRGLLRVRLAVAGSDWSRAVELARIFQERWPVSPLRAEVDSLDQQRARPRARKTELERWLKDLRQTGAERNPRAALEIGWLQLRELQSPQEALRTFSSLPETAEGNQQAEARMGRLAALVELNRLDEAREEWEAEDRLLARSPWGLPALRALWSAESTPSPEQRRERITLLEGLRRAGQCDSASLAGELLDQWNGLREAIGAEGGSAQSQADCARKALQWADSLREPDPGRLLARSLCRETLGDKESARQDWLRILRESVEDPAALVAARNLALDERADSLVRDFVLSHATEDWAWHPVSAGLQRKIAVLERRAGRPEVSLAICRRLLAEDEARRVPLPGAPPPDPRLLDELAQGLEQIGERAEARRAWFRALGGPVLADTALASRLLLRVARSFHSDGRDEDARRACRTLTTVFPGTPAAGGAVRLLAALESGTGRNADALILLESLRPAKSADLSLRTQWIKSLARAGREKSSRQELQRLLKENNSRVSEDTVKAAVGLALGLGLLERDQPAEAEKAFGQVAGKLDKTPQASAAQLGVARALQAQGKDAASLKALVVLEKRWPRAPERAGAAALRAELAEAAGDTTQALASLERAVELSAPLQREAALGRLIDGAERLRRPLVRRQALERYVTEHAQARGALTRRLELGELLARAGETATARAALRSLQAEADETCAAEIQYRLGEVAESEGDLPGAILEYQKVPHLKDASRLDWDASAMFAATRCWEALGRPGEARETLRQIVQRHGAGSGHGLRAAAELERLGTEKP